MTADPTTLARFDELCTLLRQNDGSVTRVEQAPYEISGYGYRFGQALLQNNFVTHLHIDTHSILTPNATTLDDAAPLLQYLQTSTSLKEVTIRTFLPHPLSGQLEHEILQALAVNSNIVTVDARCVPRRAPDSLALFLTTTTSVTKLTLSLSPTTGFSIDASSWRRLATAVGTNRTINDLTIYHAYQLDPTLIQQLGTHPMLHTLSLFLTFPEEWSCEMEHFTALAAMLASATTRLQSLALQHYHFNRPLLGLILNTLGRNATITKLVLRYCDLDEEATEDFVNFGQRQCHQGTSVLSDISITSSRTTEMFAGENVGSVAATMLIGSALQSLQLSDREENGPPAEEADHAIDLVAFFETLSDNAGQIRLASLSVEAMDWPGAYALADYLPNATHLRSLAVSRMNVDIDSSLLVAALRRNGSLHSVVITKVPVADSELLRPFFTPDELRQVQVYSLRNQEIPRLLQQPVVVSTDMRTDDESSNNLCLYTRLFVATRPTVRIAPNHIVTGLLSGDETLGV